MPVSLASMHLVHSTTRDFIHNMYELLRSTTSVSEQLAMVRKLYEARNIPNQIPDGTVPFPEDASQIWNGISMEFRYVGSFILAKEVAKSFCVVARNVSFKYPGADQYALRNVSFSLDPGQLCVRAVSN